MKKKAIALAIAGLYAVAAGAASTTYHLVVSLSSESSTVGSFSLSPTSLNFDGIQAGSSTIREVVIRNTGAIAQRNPLIQLVQNNSEFFVAHDCPAILGVGSACTVRVTYQPEVTSEPAQLSVTLTPAGTQSVALTGEPTFDQLRGGQTYDYGSVVTGQSASHVFTLHNEGNASASLSYSGLPSSVTRAGTCGSALAAGASCTLELTWAPTGGNLNATLKVTGTHSNTQYELRGTAVLAAAVEGGGSQDFGNVILGNSSTKIWTLTNAGQAAAPLTYSGLPADIVKAGSCGSELAGGTSCTVELTWTPTSAGPLNGTLQVGGQTLSFSGIALTPASVSGGSTQAFGNVFVGDTATKTWTLTNSGQATANLTYGSLPAGVAKTGTCGATLAGGASCTVILTWTPTAAGAMASTTFTAGGQNFVFSGTAVAKTYTGTVSAASHAFGQKVLNTTTTQAFTLTNTGNQALTLPANVGSGLTAPYSVTDDCGTSLAAGASCTAAVTYKPTAAGAHSQTLTIDMGDAGSKAVTLTGTGLTPANLTGGGAQSFGTVTVGQSKSLTWTITNTGQTAATLTYGVSP